MSEAYTNSGYGLQLMPSGAISAPFSPTSNNKVGPNGSEFQRGQDWFNTVTRVWYKYDGGGVWIITAGSSGALNQLTGDTGTALPNAGSIQIAGADGVITSATGSVVTIRPPLPSITGTVTTTDATLTDLITFPCGTVAGTYTFSIYVAGYATVGAGVPLAIGYTIVGSVRTNGSTTATLVAGQAIDAFEEGAMSACLGALAASSNNAILQVTGVAAYTIKWKGLLEYVFVPAV